MNSPAYYMLLQAAAHLSYGVNPAMPSFACV